MVIDEDGGKIRRTPPSHCTDNLVLRFTEIDIGADYNYGMTCRMKVIGNIAAYYRRNLDRLDNDKRQTFIKRRFPGSGKTFEIILCTIENLEDICKPLIINIEARFIKPFRKIGSKLYVNPYMFYSATEVETTILDERSIPVNLGYPKMIVDSVTVRWHSEINIDSIVVPDSDSLTFAFGNIKTDSEIKDGIVFINTEKSYFDYQIDPDYFENFSIFRKKVKNIYSQHIKLLK